MTPFLRRVEDRQRNLSQHLKQRFLNIVSNSSSLLSNDIGPLLVISAKNNAAGSLEGGSAEREDVAKNIQ